MGSGKEKQVQGWEHSRTDYLEGQLRGYGLRLLGGCFLRQPIVNQVIFGFVECFCLFLDDGIQISIDAHILFLFQQELNSGYLFNVVEFPEVMFIPEI